MSNIYKRIFRSTADCSVLYSHFPSHVQGRSLRRSNWKDDNNPAGHEYVLECTMDHKKFADNFVELFDSELD